MSFGTWLGVRTATAEGDRAALAYARILEKPTSVTFKTPAGTTLAAQTVRIEVDDFPTMGMGDSGMTGAVRKLVVFGITGHATLDDTVMEEGYRFIHNDDEYRITDVLVTLGSLQGNAEAVG